MHATSGPDHVGISSESAGRAGPVGTRPLILTTVALMAAGLLLGGCAEFVHMGRMNDREYASAVAGVKIEQQQEDGSWRKIGETDGSGKWWILKSEYQGGGRIRLSKKGYGTQVMTDNEFMQASSMLMSPESVDESDTNSPWR